MKRLLTEFFTLVPFYVVMAQTPSHSLLWEKKFTYGGTIDQPRSILIAPSNSFMIDGFKEVSLTGEKRAAVATFSSDGTMGNVILDTTFGGAAWGNQFALPGSGIGMYLALQIELQSRFYLTYRDVQGVEVWRKLMISDTYLIAYGDSVIATSGGNSPICYLIAPDGTVKNQFSLGSRLTQVVPRIYGDTLYVSGQTGTASSLRKFDFPKGSFLWERSVANGVQSATTIDDLGNVYFAGSFMSNDTMGFLHHFLIKYSPDGTTQWSRDYLSRDTYETNYENWTASVTVSTAKNLVVVGGTIQRGSIHDWNKSSYLECFSASIGNSVWKKVWIYSLVAIINQIRSVRFDHDDNLIVLGNIAGGLNNLGYLQKYYVDKVTNVKEEEMNSIPESFLLYQNYPNPFNPTTNIAYSINEHSTVKITVYDRLGREVESLVNREHQPGYYKISFNASKLASGVYFYRMQAGSFIETKKMILMK